jgi:hypothetical protein
MEVTRTFDLVDLGCKVCPREVMFGGKHGNEWITYSTEAVRETDRPFLLWHDGARLQKG